VLLNTHIKFIKKLRFLQQNTSINNQPSDIYFSVTIFLYGKNITDSIGSILSGLGKLCAANNR